MSSLRPPTAALGRHLQPVKAHAGGSSHQSQGRVSLPKIARITFDELIRSEDDPSKNEKLCALRELWATDKTSSRDVRADKEAQIVLLEEKVTRLTVDLLRTAGLNDTRGLYEFLQQKILERHSITRKGAEATWEWVLELDPDLQRCLRSHLKPSVNLPTHLAGIYHTLSSEVHAASAITATGREIVFHADYLTPDQSLSMVCLGAAVGISVKPAPRSSLSMSGVELM